MNHHQNLITQEIAEVDVEQRPVTPVVAEPFHFRPSAEYHIFEPIFGSKNVLGHW